MLILRLCTALHLLQLVRQETSLTVKELLLDLTEVKPNLLEIKLELIVSMLDLEHGLLQAGQRVFLLDVVVATQLLYTVHQGQGW